MANSIPDSIYTYASTLVNVGRVLKPSDFNFIDKDGDLLQAVAITKLPSAGVMQLNGVDIVEGQTITAAELTAGQLVFIPATDAYGDHYASFEFKASDGIGWSYPSYFDLIVNPVASAGDDRFLGDGVNDVYDGLAGNDYICGGERHLLGRLLA